MDEMDYVMHSPEPATPRSQHQRQPSGCPFMRGDIGGSPSTQGNANAGFPLPPRFDLPDLHGGNSPWYNGGAGSFQYYHSPPIQQPSSGAPPQMHPHRDARLPPPRFFVPGGPANSQAPLPSPFPSLADPSLMHDPFMGSFGWAGPRPPHTSSQNSATRRLHDHYHRMNPGAPSLLLLPGQQQPQAPPVLPQAPTQRHFHSHHRHNSQGNPYLTQYAPMHLDRILPSLSTPSSSSLRNMPDLNYPAPATPPHPPSSVPQPLNDVQHAGSEPPRAAAAGSDSPTRQPPQPAATSDALETSESSSARQSSSSSRQPNPHQIPEDSPITTGLPRPTRRPVTYTPASQRLDALAIPQLESQQRLLVSTTIPTHLSDDDSDLEEEEAALRFMTQFAHDPILGVQRLSREDSIRTHQLLRGAVSSRRVASKAALATLESVELSSLPENERMCIICYNDFNTLTPEGINEAPLRLPKCKHVFGDHCIKKWFEESDSCPYCRDKVPSESQARANTRAINDILLQNRARLNSQLAAHRSSQPASNPAFGATAGGSATPSGWQPGERRSPPDDGEQRRRTRPRHASFRSSAMAATGPLMPRPNSFGGASAASQGRDVQSIFNATYLGHPAPPQPPAQPQTTQSRQLAQQASQQQPGQDQQPNQQLVPNPTSEPRDTVMANTGANQYPAPPSLPGMSSLGLDAPSSAPIRADRTVDLRQVYIGSTYVHRQPNLHTTTTIGSSSLFPHNRNPFHTAPATNDGYSAHPTSDWNLPRSESQPSAAGHAVALANTAAAPQMDSAPS